MTERTPLINSSASAARVPWAERLEVSLPSGFMPDVEFDDAAALIDQVRLAKAFTNTRPTSSRLPFSYQAVPLWLRTMIGGVIGRMRRRQQEQWAAFPRYPLDLSADYLADLLGSTPSPFATGPTPVLFSHDLDTGEGLANAVHMFLPLEEKYGARSACYIVPCGWPIDHSSLSDLHGRGHEVGIHGYDHSNLTPFAEPAERRARLDAAQDMILRYDVTGYRAPSLVRTRTLLQDLARLYKYDSSIPTSGGLFPVPNNGCASARPFRVCGIPEIPLSLPRDGSLRFLGYGPDEIYSIWCASADLIARSGGVVSLLTHCEERFSGNKPMLIVYERFLNHLAESGRFAFSTTGEILSRMSSGGE
jgi:peptidoglycan/xylan/chitin deacetylase (PgdA/CDA1 family)